MSTSQRWGAVGLGAVAVGLAVFLMQPPEPSVTVAVPSDDAPPPAAVERMPTAPYPDAVPEPVEVPVAAVPEDVAAKLAAGAMYDSPEARKGPFDLTPEGAERLLNAHQRRVAACRTALASKAKGPLKVTLTIRSSEGGPGYVAVATPDPDAAGVNVSLGPCLSDAFGEARFPDPFGEKELVVELPEPRP